jgi:hypothetical protein
MSYQDGQHLRLTRYDVTGLGSRYQRQTSKFSIFAEYVVTFLIRANQMSIVEHAEAISTLLGILEGKQTISKSSSVTPAEFDLLVQAEHKIHRSLSNTVLAHCEDYYYWGKI